MSRRRIKLNEEDLTKFLSDALRDAGYMEPLSKIIGLEYKTKTIKKGGDYYKDPASPDDKEVEVVKFIQVLTETKAPKRSDEDELQDETE